MGMMVSFGQSSGPMPPFDLAILAQKGSLFLTRPSLMTYTAVREDLLGMPATCSRWSRAERSRWR